MTYERIDVGVGASVAVVVEAVAYDESIGDVASHVVHRHLALQPFWLMDKYADAYGGGVELL